MSTGQRGKWSEQEVRKVLSAMEAAYKGFAFNRIPDARGGFMQPADADFQWFFDTGETVGLDGYHDSKHAPYTRNGVIEVKQVEHATLLPHKNFSSDKITRVWRRHMAGCESLVLVAHKLKGMTKPKVTWRSVPLSFFRDTEYVKGVGSWDLSQFKLLTNDELEALLWDIVKK